MDVRNTVLLGFLFITILTALAVLGAAVGLLPRAAPQLISWGIPAVLGEIVATVVLFARSGGTRLIDVNLVFDGATADEIVLDPEGCWFRVMDASGVAVKEGRLGPTLGHGGWQIRIPAGVQADQSLMLSLRDQNGVTWIVRPFAVFVQTQIAHRSA